MRSLWQTGEQSKLAKGYLRPVGNTCAISKELTKLMQT